MKKIVLMAVALALATVAFAKPAKVAGWKDVSKIADKNKMEVVNDDTNWYVAKGNGGKDFAFYAVKEFADATITLAMSCVKGEVYSRISWVDKRAEAPYPVLAMNGGDEKCSLVNASQVEIYYDDQTIKECTETLKKDLKDISSEVAKNYGLVIPR